MKRIRLVITRFVIFPLVLSGCASSTHNAEVISLLTGVALVAVGYSGNQPHDKNMLEGFEPWTEDSGSYRLQPGDELDIKLHYNPEFSDRVIVNPDGYIHLFPIGPVNVNGRSVSDLVNELRERYAVEFKHPDVTVIPRQFGSEIIYVGGEVQRPGVLKLSTNMGLLQGILEAGGGLPTGNLDQVVLLRPTYRNTRMIRVVNVQALLEGKSNQDVRLNRFDVIYVPRTTVAEIGLWIDQHINQMLPFQRSFGYTMNRPITPVTGQ